MAEWISVKDRLPEEGSYVLVFVNLGYGYTIGTSLYLNKSFKMDENITHWMPLPEPPKGE